MYITLRAARICRGYTLEEVAIICGIPISTLEAFEYNCEDMPASLAYQLSSIYNISWDWIYIGAREIA